MTVALYFRAHPTDAVLDRAGLTIDWMLARRSFHHLGWAGITGDTPFPKARAPELTALRAVKPFAFHYDWNSSAGFGTVFLTAPLYALAQDAFDGALTRLTEVTLSFGKKSLPYVIGQPTPACDVGPRIDFSKSRFCAADYNDMHRFGTRRLRGQTLAGDAPPVIELDLAFPDFDALKLRRRDGWKGDAGDTVLPERLSLTGNSLPALLIDGTDLYVSEALARNILGLYGPVTPGVGFPFSEIEVTLGS